jgi:hypothetical protein
MALASIAVGGCSCAETETIVCCVLEDARSLRSEDSCSSSGGRAEPAATCGADAGSDGGAAIDALVVLDTASDGALDAGVVDAGDEPDDVSPDAIDAGPLETCLGAEGRADGLASSVAFSADGARVILGAESNSGFAPGAGHARVFERAAGGWMQVGEDLDGEAMGDRFGVGVAMSSNGTRVAVGAYLHEGATGRVRVFDLDGASWAQVGASLDGAGRSYGHGASLALSGDGTRLVVGGPGVSTTSGHVVVYELRAGVWETTGTFAGTSEDGTDVDISDDGQRIAIGAPSRLGGSPGGQARMFEWTGTDWASMGEIAGVAASDGAGTSVSLSSDGSRIAIGAPYHAGGGLQAGQVRVFRWTGDAWAQMGADLLGRARERLGTSVRLSADGTRVLAGGPNDGGAVRLYTLVADAWEQASSPVFHTTGRNGTDVAISADGRTIAASAPYEHGGAGEVCLYDVP